MAGRRTTGLETGEARQSPPLLFRAALRSPSGHLRAAVPSGIGVLPRPGLLQAA